jgi:mono/diheme cytochrome c family protein
VYAGFDAPGLREILQAQLPRVAEEPMPESEGLPLTYLGSIGALLQGRCGNCHGQGGIQGLNLTVYQAALQGGASGPAVVPGDPEGSLLVQKQTAGQPHFGQLNQEELGNVIKWIAAGAPEG